MQTPRSNTAFRTLTSTTSLFTALAALAAIPVFEETAKADTVVFSDSTFAPITWGFEVQGDGDSQESQVLTGGNPGSKRRIEQLTNTNSGFLWGFSRYGVNGATRYAPSGGAIASVDFTIDAQVVSTVGGQNPMVAVGIKQQPGNVWVQNSPMTISGATWGTYSVNGLTAADFTCINCIGDEILDFTTSGGFIRFGFITINGSFDETATGGVSEYDNYMVTVNIAVPCFGDLDGSGEVDGGDIGLVLLDFGPCPGCTTDLDGSGEVDGGDIGLVLLSFGACE